MPREKIFIACGAGLCAILLYSAAHAWDRSTWFMEVAPVLLAAPVLAATYRRFPLAAWRQRKPR